MLDRKIQYFEPDAMATVLYGLYTPGTGEFTVSSAGHLPPVLAAPGRAGGMLPVRPDPPIGVADDPQRRSATAVIPPGALLCCFTDGLVERRDQIDRPGHRPARRDPGRAARRRPRRHERAAGRGRVRRGDARPGRKYPRPGRHRRPHAQPALQPGAARAEGRANSPPSASAAAAVELQSAPQTRAARPNGQPDTAPN